MFHNNDNSLLILYFFVLRVTCYSLLVYSLPLKIVVWIPKPITKNKNTYI